MPSALNFNKYDKPPRPGVSTVTATAMAPWQGYVPDLSVAALGPAACKSVTGLIPRADDTGLGEILGAFPGHDHVDPLYAAGTTAPLSLGGATGSQRDIVGIFDFVRTNATGAITGEYNRTLIAVTAGNGTAGDAASGQVWRIKPSTGVWEEITLATSGSEVALVGPYPLSIDTDVHGAQLVDFAVMPASSTATRTSLAAVESGVPTLVFTNNYDNVMIYPTETAVGTPTYAPGSYEDIEIANFTNFKCRSVETWGDRMNFLNTVESGTRYPRRLRRSAIGEPSPDTAQDGSGAIDFRDFQGQGLRVESLGNVLACYFEDGVAFVRRTGQSQSPYTVQTVTTERGLLATHALVNLGGGTHFGLFTDGWFFLNENGQFSEAGISQGDGVRSPKWRRTFFERLDINQRSRIDMVYDARNQWVHITLPLDGASENNEVWTYDIPGDRLFVRQNFKVTKFGTGAPQLTTEGTLGGTGIDATLGVTGLGLDLVSSTIGGLTGTIGGFASQYGLETVLHGTVNGQVCAQDETLTSMIVLTENGVSAEPTWNYETVLSGMGDSRNHKTVREVVVETIKASLNDFNVQVFTNATGLSETQTFPEAATGNLGDARVLTRGFRFTAPQVSLKLSGTAPFKMRSFEVDVVDTGSRVRIGG